MKVLITGATGFIARALIPVLTASGFDVRPAVRVLHGLPGEVVIGNINSATEWSEALLGCEAVVHLAALAECDESNFVDCHAVNVDGTLNLARQAAKAGVRRFVFLSSVKVHGEGGEQVFREDDLPAPHDAYARSKWAAEEGLAAIAAETTLEIVILRPPLVYGPGAKGNFASMEKAIARGWPLPLGAVRNNRRSLVGVDNLADFILTCLIHPAAANQTFLVSDSEHVSTAELLDRLGKAMSRPSSLFPVPSSWLHLVAKLLGREAVVRRLLGSLQVDIRKAHDKLGWQPKFTLDEGLLQAVKRRRP